MAEQTVEVQVLEDDNWDTTLEFKVPGRPHPHPGLPDGFVPLSGSQIKGSETSLRITPAEGVPGAFGNRTGRVFLPPSESP